MITFDLNVATLLQPVVLAVGAWGLIVAKKALVKHADGKAQEIKDELAGLRVDMSSLGTTVEEHGAILRTHGEDIAYLKGIQAGEAKLGQAANLVAAAISPTHPEEKKP